MTYEEKIPEFALQPAKPVDEAESSQSQNDGFDPTPYDRLLAPEEYKEENSTEAAEIKGAEKTEENQAQDAALEELLSAPSKDEVVKEEKQKQQESVILENTINVAEHLGKNVQNKENQQSLGEESKKEIQEKNIKTTESEQVQPVFFQSREAVSEENLPAAPDPVKIIPMENAAVYKDLKMNIISQKIETTIFVEEDILVPDIKPDLKKILSMDGRSFVSSKEIQVGQESEDNVRITGEVLLQTIYLPESKEDGEAVSIIQSRLPFKTDWQVSASPMSRLSIISSVEKIDYTIINERKFRAKVTVVLSLSEYAEKELQMFDSIRGEDLELLKETVKISHVALRKEEFSEIAEDLKLKEGSLRPVKILKSDIRVVENHKQITSEKMVINANVMVNILYMGEEEGEDGTYSRPAFFQGKTDFTQFILMDKFEDAAMCRAVFNDQDLEVKISEEGDCFHLKGSITTSVEVLTNMEKEMVTDLYHSVKDTTYDSTESQIETVIGTGMTETSAREILNVPDNVQADKVIYVGGRVKEKREAVEQGRVMVEGILSGEVICLFDDDEKRAFSIKQDIPFRGAMEIPAAQLDMKAESKVEIRDLWFDKINGKQIEVNASLQVEAAVIKVGSLKLIKNPCFVESNQIKRPCSMVIYITKRDDSLWKIAKKYKISMNTIRAVNQIEEGTPINEGTRLLIVK